MARLLSRLALLLERYGLLLAVAAALLLYARSLGYAFSGDDPSGHFRFIERVPWPQWFTTSSGFIVRPMVFVAERVLWLVSAVMTLSVFISCPC